MRRVSPHELPLLTVGYLAGSKKFAQWPRGGIDFSLSFVFGAPGICRVFGKTWPLNPPCIFTTWPGVPTEFGPQAGQAWEEFYVCYATEFMPILKRRGLADKNRPVWPILNPTETRQGLNDLYQLLLQCHELGQIDRIDRLCDLLLTDTLIALARRTVPDRMEQAVRAIAAEATQTPGRVDFNDLARRHGLSPTHFRRIWRRFFTTSPARYILQQRMTAACRMLVETDLHINEIANALGFSDALYFSKQFHRLNGITASAYRRQYQIRPQHD